MYGGMHAVIDRALVPTVSLILPKNLAGLHKWLVEKDFGGLFFDILRRAKQDSEENIGKTLPGSSDIGFVDFACPRL